MLLPVGLLVALGCEQLINLTNKYARLKWFAAIVLIFILGIEVAAYQPHNTPISEWVARQTALREALPAELPADPILFVYRKVWEPFYLSELDGMIFAQDRGIPTLNGYWGHDLPGYVSADPCIPKVIRLYGYALHRCIPLPAMYLFADSIVTVGASHCDSELVIPLKGNVWGQISPCF
jgi:hypothetical protein